jgi:uncharacterized damage-inducible protein DinB/heme-degrading monooxygenase HmoA
MITRVWHGRTKKENAEAYKQYVIDTGIQDYLRTEGNLDVEIWQRDEENETHIFTVTHWKDLQSIKKFAGEDYVKARYYSEDEKYLLELEESVKHYKSFSFSNREIKNYIKQLEELYDGDNWTDENFEKKINSINEETAFLQPQEGKHSVSEVLWHCIFWRRVITKRMNGDWSYGKEFQEEQNFLSLNLLKERGWQNIISDFAETNNLLIDLLKSKTNDFLEEVYPNGYTNRYIIEGIIAHDYYHLGQIGFIISLLNSGEKRK